ncbi:MAG TPA: hypothetical protein VJ044_16690 [Candidatus Hodarchaeales archaeon]|nr:hypothetical protein [Candidatus Hodarchaeales archaeon]
MDDNEKRARALRLGTVRNLLADEFLDEEQAKELLQGPLTPGDDSTIRDDSNLLHAAVDTILEFFGWIAKPPKS